MKRFLFAVDCMFTKFVNSRFGKRFKLNFAASKSGMELVQVAILIGIAVALGLVFRKQIKDFVDDVFGELKNAKF